MRFLVFALTLFAASASGQEVDTTEVLIPVLAMPNLQELPPPAHALIWEYAEQGGEGFSPTAPTYWTAIHIGPSCFVHLYASALQVTNENTPPLPLGVVPGLCDLPGTLGGWYAVTADL